ncbi:Hypothetical predicted protein [Pelobates cultripes]|uniref:Beta/gamma crystallin 'Greek key' domain-containing protein n=1 Tax=Pelobates cultripes TaxID=61616 RepID=A0AAD1W7X1_PELCU|nr:Hypothetical predicted protein [Pelobates cultripes]
MSKIELYDDLELTGDSVSIEADNPDLTSTGFLKRTQSLKVHGEPWVVFSNTNYQGDFKVFKEGSYHKLPNFSNVISSLRVVTSGLQQPKIIVHERPNQSGVQRIISNVASSLDSFGISGVCSHKVEKGVWILYDGEQYQGSSIVSITGDKVDDETIPGLSGKVRSLKPYLVYETPN